MKIFVLIVCIVGICALLPEPSMSKKKKSKTSSDPSPILFVPGIAGSQLNVKRTKLQLFSPCTTFKKYVKLWLQPVQMIWRSTCIAKDLKLRYDSSTDSYRNNSNVKVYAPGFGKTSTVEYLVKILNKEYARTFVRHFVDRGYVRSKSIRAAPYDWRLAADELEKRGYYDRLKDLVEDMYEENGNTKVTIVAHSMGGLVSHHFLTGYAGISKKWKKKYINAWVPLGVPWGGAVETIQTIITKKGKSMLKYKSKKDRWWRLLAPFGRTFESTPWLLPKPSVWGNTELVSTPRHNYTAKDYKQLFKDVRYKNGYKMYQGIVDINKGYPCPNVPTYCYYGIQSENKTPAKLTYKYPSGTLFYVQKIDPINMVEPVISYGEGDGTVNARSLRVCKKWSKMKRKYHFAQEEFDTSHTGILKSQTVLAKIADIVRAPPALKFLFF